MSESKTVISAPMIITSRLIPGVKLGNGTLSVESDGMDNGKVRCTYILDFVGPSGERLEYICNELSVGVIHGDDASSLVRKAVRTALSFVSAEAESYRIGMGERPQDGWIFNAAVAEWAYQNADEIEMVALEMDDDDA